MAARSKTDTGLQWEVLTVKRPGLTRDLPPGKEELMWVANSSTLIHGERDAVLVDTFLTTEQSKTLLDWVVARGKNLTAIYITHGHGDHFFGLASLLERFPRAKALATPEIVKAMQDQLSPASVDNFWRRRSCSRRRSGARSGARSRRCCSRILGDRLEIHPIHTPEMAIEILETTAIHEVVVVLR